MIDHQQLRISYGFRLGAMLRIRVTVVKELNGTVYTVFLASRVLVASHVMLLEMFEPRELYRTDGKRPEGVTMSPREMCKKLVWDVTVVDALAPSRLNQGSWCILGTAIAEAETRKFEKSCEL